MIDLNANRARFIELATKFFETLILMSPDLRSDDKIRTGINVFMQVPGTRNSIFFSVGQPSEQAMAFSVEKAVRSNLKGHTTSWESRNPEKMEFGGSTTTSSLDFLNDEPEEYLLQVSVSGLKEEEDAALSLLLQAEAWEDDITAVTGAIYFVSDKKILEFEQFDNLPYLHQYLGIAA